MQTRRRYRRSTGYADRQRARAWRSATARFKQPRSSPSRAPARRSAQGARKGAPVGLVTSRGGVRPVGAHAVCVWPLEAGAAAVWRPRASAGARGGTRLPTSSAAPPADGTRRQGCPEAPRYGSAVEIGAQGVEVSPSCIVINPHAPTLAPNVQFKAGSDPGTPSARRAFEGEPIFSR